MQRFKFDGITVDEMSRTMTGGQTRLARHPLELLLYLLQNRGRAIPFEEIKKRCWPEDKHVEDDKIHNLLAKIRKALGDTASKHLTSPITRTVMFRNEGVIGEEIGNFITPPHSAPLDRTQQKLINNSNGLVITRDELLTRITENRDGAAFRILLLFENANRDCLIIERHARVGRQAHRYVLKVDLTGQNLGIFSNRGKDWLDQQYKLKELNDESGIAKRLLESSKNVHDFLMGRQVDTDVLRWRDVTSGVVAPLRWGSGGSLPIARYEDDDWAVLFFRDRKPIGLNLANGASEVPEEWLNPGYLSSRELAEEISVQQGMLRPGGVLQYNLVDDYEGSPIHPGTRSSAEISEFMSHHNLLREQHDGITITSAIRQRDTQRVATDFSVQVTDGPIKSNEWRNFLLSINPLESGIETIRIARIDLQRGDWLVDGEIIPSTWDPHPYLLRRPVILIRLSTLRALVDKDGSLGNPIHDESRPDFFDCKQLPDLPKEAVRLFVDFELDDVDRRRKRQAVIERHWQEAGLVVNDLSLKKWSELHNHYKDHWSSDRLSTIRAWHREWNQIESFMKEYGASLLDLEKTRVGNGPWMTNLRAGPFTTLCPVTWKSLELAFKWGYL